MRKYQITIFLVLLLVVVKTYAQTAPNSYTPNFRFRMWAQGANPSADSLNANWKDVDHQIYKRGWQLGNSKIYPTVAGWKTYFRNAASDTAFGGRLVNVAGSLFVKDTLITDGEIKIKNVPYTWPSINASGVLTNNGNGTLTWAIGAGGDTSWIHGTSKIFQRVSGDVVYIRTNVGDTTTSNGSIFNVTGKSSFSGDIILGAGFRNVSNSFGTNQVGFLSGELVLSNPGENDFQTRNGQIAINRKDTTSRTNMKYAATFIAQARGTDAAASNYAGEGGLYTAIFDQTNKPQGVMHGVNIDIRVQRPNGNTSGGSGGPTYTNNKDSYGLGITSADTSFMNDGIYMNASAKSQTNSYNPNGIGIQNGITMDGRYGYILKTGPGSYFYGGIDLSGSTIFANGVAFKTGASDFSSLGRVDFGSYIDVAGVLYHRTGISVLNYTGSGYANWVTRKTSSPSGIELSNIYRLSSNGSADIVIDSPLQSLAPITATGFKNVGNSFGTNQVGFLSGELVLSNPSENDFQTRGGQIAINQKDTSQPSGMKYAATIVVQSRGDGGSTFSGRSGLFIALFDQAGKPNGISQGININMNSEQENGPAWGGSGGSYNPNLDMTGLGLESVGSKYVSDMLFIDAHSKTTTTKNPYGVGAQTAITIGGKLSYLIGAATTAVSHYGINFTNWTGLVGDGSDRAIHLPNGAISDLGIVTVSGTAARITSGTGVPTSADPNGSIFLRTDGASGSTFYVRESGNWVAK